ncbi:MAG: molecular chaperone HtpG [Deltaproteobacteria bacterium]|nr:molecular chaperone HtpG [Deltaproteobacteria bacterium]MBN2673933.1 molecular chaperone HtpG [Deltaproteobacteria bacterium]
MTSKKQSMKFEAETKQLLEIMINSLYTEKEVFLRELISNASDALDKLRFSAVTDKSLIPEGFEGKIRIEPDTQNRTLTISDNGIGMTHDEVITNIGTIARSGTHELIKSLEKQKTEKLPAELIGRFGVGFYSCLMVADSVSLTTRKAGEETATVWEYAGGEEYSVTEGSRDSQGTTIVLKLKDADPEDGLEDFTREWVIKRIVKKYSDFVRYPIVLPVEREEGEDDKKEKVIKDETLNSMKALWQKAPDDVKDEELNKFYKHVASDWTDPLLHISMKAEGRYEYQTLLFIPSNAPFDLFSQSYKRGLQLYARNVKIMDLCEDVLPEYMRFVKGVLDAQDLPLNISRETLQNNRQISTIRSTLTKKIISELNKLKTKEEEKYLKFWDQFGAVMKEGVHSDFENREKLLPLLLFQSTNDKEKLTSLEEYKSRMKDDQEDIYYLSGESREIIENSPHLEAFTQKGFEVLLFTDPIDDFMVSGLPEFEGKKLKSIGKGDVELGSEAEKKALEDKQKDFEKFLEALGKPIEAHVSKVQLSNRLTSSPCCLVGSEGDLSPHIERMMKQSKLAIPSQKRVMELNADHDVIVKLKKSFDEGLKDEELSEAAQLLLGQALLAESSPLPDPAGFARLVAKLMI